MLATQSAALPMLTSTSASTSSPSRVSSDSNAYQYHTPTQPHLSTPSLNALLDHRINTQPNIKVLCAANPTSTLECFQYDELTYAQLDDLVVRACDYYSRLVPPRRRGDRLRTVALLACSGPDYVVTEMALCRLGHCCLLLSPNNSVPALVHLLKVCKADHIIITRDQATAANETVAQLAGEKINLTPQPCFQTFDLNLAKIPRPAVCPRSELSFVEESNETAFVVHSSGSTGFPKPIFISHRASVANLTSSFGFDALVTVPLCHNYGHASLWRAIWSLRRLFILPQAIAITPQNLTKAIVGCLEQGAMQLYAVPTVLKLMAETSNGLELLARFNLVVSAGSACPSEIGELLVRGGTKLVCNYGATEVGQLMTSMRDFAKDDQWQALRLTQAFRPYCRLEQALEASEGQDALFELIVLPGWPPMTKTNRPDGSYATSDLFAHHSSIADALVFAGRSDDTLVHSTGEKTNPVPMELDIGSSRLVKSVLVFGDGRPQAGCLIVPAPSLETAHVSEARKQIWPAIEAANRKAPSHSRILPELVTILPSTTRFSAADKGSFIRAKVLATHADEIAAAYHRYEHGDKTSDRLKVETVDATVMVVRKLVGQAVVTSENGMIPSDEQDLFDYGIDSIVVTRISSLINSAIEFPIDARLSPTAAFDYPSISKLAQHVYTLVTLARREAEGAAESIREMEEMVVRFSAQLQDRKVAPNACTPFSKHTIVLTGATGSLGSHLVHQLSLQESVQTIYCLCRAKSDVEAVVRVDQSLLRRKLPSLEQLCSATSTRIVCVQSDLTRGDMGLDSSTLKAILDTVTVVLHNAWPVNFNMNVGSFASSIKGCVNLMNLSSQCHCSNIPRFLFSSSVSAAARREQEIILEEVSSDPRDAQEMGYARSKWIAEALCAEASKHGYEVVILRIGQMVGDSVHGIWNDTEAIPLMFKAAQTIGALPELKGEQVSWLPVDTAAWIISSLASKDPVMATTSSVIHVVNDQLTAYSSVLKSMQSALANGFKVIPNAEWVQLLRTAKDQNIESNPPIKLVEFFANKYCESPVEKEVERESINKDLRRQKHLHSTSRLRQSLDGEGHLSQLLQSIDDAFVHRMVDAWKQTGFM